MMEKRTTQDLKFLLVYAAGVGFGVKEEAIAELLRRERERCLDVVEMTSCDCRGCCDCGSTAKRIARAIRDLPE